MGPMHAARLDGGKDDEPKFVWEVHTNFGSSSLPTVLGKTWSPLGRMSVALFEPIKSLGSMFKLSGLHLLNFWAPEC
jgi:hypothetical protein